MILVLSNAKHGLERAVPVLLKNVAIAAEKLSSDKHLRAQADKRKHPHN